MKRMLVLVLFAVAGCAPVESYTMDQCLRQELFERCMKLLPAGPVATQYNDWDDVVSECAEQAHYAALRAPEMVPVACRSHKR